MGLIYGTSSSGSVVWPLVFTPNGMQPVDNRTVVQSESDLNIHTTFDLKYYLGMQVYVQDTKTLYILTGTTGNGVWTKLPSQEDLQKALDANKKELFTFKGVASAIDEDRCTITVGYAMDGDDNKYTIKQQAYDILKETMYGWESETNNNVYWTHESTGTLSPVYIKGNKTKVTCLIYQGDVYYLKSANVYESLDGDFLYQSEGKYYLDEKHQQEVTSVTTETYDGYVFTKVADDDVKLELKTPDDGGQTANSDNIGHVYQIGEEEYASNGSIWVQLGSPKEDWIVIK